MLSNVIPLLLCLFFFYLIYSCLRGAMRNFWLLAASYAFYALWDWRFITLLLITTGIDYCVGLGLAATGVVWKRRMLLLFSLSINIGILFFFKYFNFFAESMVVLLETIGFAPDPITIQILLPMGISFYTFRSITYTVDIYRKQGTPTRNLLNYAVFVSFFPELVAGPIERARTFLPQIAKDRRVTYLQIREGSWLLLLGLFKKVVVADNMAVIADKVFNAPGEQQGMAVLLGIYAFTFQIYGDFSGYTDMARGLARLMGFDPARNFRMPYFAVNPRDFWRRWHISLSTWLRDYLYISMGGNRKGRFRTSLNLFLTMLLGGLWHGAAWNFVLWGTYHGLALIVHRLWLQYRGEIIASDALWTRFVKIIFTFHFVAFGWILFRINTIDNFWLLLGNLAVPVFSNADWILHIAFFIWPLLLLQVMMEYSGNMLVVKEMPKSGRFCIYMFLFALILLCGRVETYEFIYAQF